LIVRGTCCHHEETDTVALSAAKMLLALLERIWTNTVLYLISLWLAWSARQYSTISMGLLVGTSTFYFINFASHVQQERTIKALGGHGPQIMTWTPWNLSFLYERVTHGKQNLNHVFWAKVSSVCV
jgi:hypothetical protein